jgi:hypothetical protein
MQTQSEIISHWYTGLENFNTSSQQFYQALDAAIKKRQIPDLRVGRSFYSEGGLLSAKREYLRVQRKDLFFDVCAAPFGTGFFVSWWLTKMPPGCLLTLTAGIPVINTIVLLFAPPFTHYRIDTALMFQTATHSAVLEVVDSITASQGIRGLSEAERKPVMSEFYNR